MTQRPDDLYLAEIVEACRHVQEFLRSVDEVEWAQSELIRSAVNLKLIVIGEAAGAISDDLRTRYASIPWSQIRAYRNLAIHAYFAINWAQVWEIATDRVPQLEQDIAKIIGIDYPALAAELRVGRRKEHPAQEISDSPTDEPEADG